QEMLQSSPAALPAVSNPPPGIVVPAAALPPGNLAMSTGSSPAVPGGALYQPVTMVTSQGQVLAQAIAPGALQIPNAQV
ncbi:PKNX2 protein, partial [Casuarius casuarius]|nr:PKNX2 protein [Casuarius casuarius]